MSEEIYYLLQNMYELAEAQRSALHGGDYKEVLSLQTKRQDIIDKIQNIDGFVHLTNRPVGKNSPAGDDFSPFIRKEIEKILSIDREMQTFIQKELTSIADLLEAVQRAKTFCNNTTYSKKAGMLNLTA